MFVKVNNVREHTASIKGLRTNNMTLSAVLVSRDQHNNFVSIIVSLQGSREGPDEDGTRMEIKISLRREKARRA